MIRSLFCFVILFTSRYQEYHYRHIEMLRDGLLELEGFRAYARSRCLWVDFITNQTFYCYTLIRFQRVIVQLTTSTPKAQNKPSFATKLSFMRMKVQLTVCCFHSLDKTTSFPGSIKLNQLIKFIAESTSVICSSFYSQETPKIEHKDDHTDNKVWSSLC